MRAGDTLVVPKLDRLARSVPDARAIAHVACQGMAPSTAAARKVGLVFFQLETACRILSRTAPSVTKPARVCILSKRLSLVRGRRPP